MWNWNYWNLYYNFHFSKIKLIPCWKMSPFFVNFILSADFKIWRHLHCVNIYNSFTLCFFYFSNTIMCSSWSKLQCIWIECKCIAYFSFQHLDPCQQKCNMCIFFTFHFFLSDLLIQNINVHQPDDLIYGRWGHKWSWLLCGTCPQLARVLRQDWRGICVEFVDGVPETTLRSRLGPDPDHE